MHKHPAQGRKRDLPEEDGKGDREREREKSDGVGVRRSNNACYTHVSVYIHPGTFGEKDLVCAWLHKLTLTLQGKCLFGPLLLGSPLLSHRRRSHGTAYITILTGYLMPI